MYGGVDVCTEEWDDIPPCVRDAIAYLSDRVGTLTGKPGCSPAGMPREPRAKHVPKVPRSASRVKSPAYTPSPVRSRSLPMPHQSPRHASPSRTPLSGAPMGWRPSRSPPRVAPNFVLRPEVHTRLQMLENMLEIQKTASELSTAAGRMHFLSVHEGLGEKGANSMERTAKRHMRAYALEALGQALARASDIAKWSISNLSGRDELLHAGAPKHFFQNTDDYRFFQYSPGRRGKPGKPSTPAGGEVCVELDRHFHALRMGGLPTPLSGPGSTPREQHQSQPPSRRVSSVAGGSSRGVARSQSQQIHDLLSEATQEEGAPPQRHASGMRRGSSRRSSRATASLEGAEPPQPSTPEGARAGVVRREDSVPRADETPTPPAAVPVVPELHTPQPINVEEEEEVVEAGPVARRVEAAEAVGLLGVSGRSRRSSGGRSVEDSFLSDTGGTLGRVAHAPPRRVRSEASFRVPVREPPHGDLYREVPLAQPVLDINGSDDESVPVKADPTPSSTGSSSKDNSSASGSAFASTGRRGTGEGLAVPVGGGVSADTPSVQTQRSYRSSADTAASSRRSSKSSKKKSGSAWDTTRDELRISPAPSTASSVSRSSRASGRRRVYAAGDDSSSDDAATRSTTFTDGYPTLRGSIVSPTSPFD